LAGIGELGTEIGGLGLARAAFITAATRRDERDYQGERTRTDLYGDGTSDPPPVRCLHLRSDAPTAEVIQLTELLLGEVAAPGRVFMPELNACAVDAALDRRHGQIEHRRDLLVRPVLDITQDERDARLVGKRPDARG
jgi:hypothetical protein